MERDEDSLSRTIRELRAGVAQIDLIRVDNGALTIRSRRVVDDGSVRAGRGNSREREAAEVVELPGVSRCRHADCERVLACGWRERVRRFGPKSEKEKPKCGAKKKRAVEPRRKKRQTHLRKSSSCNAASYSCHCFPLFNSRSNQLKYLTSATPSRTWQSRNPCTSVSFLRAFMSEIGPRVEVTHFERPSARAEERLVAEGRTTRSCKARK